MADSPTDRDRTQRTPGGRYLIIDGRRWRATDPSIPDAFRQELVDELMAARRAVGAARGDDDQVRAARARVQDAKVALGERGEPWWAPASDAGRDDRMAAAIRTLLRHRAPDKTICPSDVARTTGGAGWRSVMDAARNVAYELADARVIEIHQKGRPVDGRAAKGPIRLARGPHFPG